MEIFKIKLHDLRNEEHFNYHTEVNELITRFTVEALKIQRYYTPFETELNNEAEALNIVRKSLYTGPIAEADHDRDVIYSGLRDTVEGACNHFKAKIAEAAQRLKIVLDSFGNISTKSYDQQTAATKALVNDLETTYAQDVADAGLGDWVGELKARNLAFETLVAERYTDESEKTPVKMKTARKALDTAYRNVVKMIDALVFIEGPEAYEAFVGELNQRVDKYNTRLNQRDGRNKKEDEE